MALINCPECNKPISDKAYSCPNCGFPMRDEKAETPLTENSEKLICPDFPEDLSIGSHISLNAFWKGEYGIFQGYFDDKENFVKIVPSSKVSIYLNNNGIAICKFSVPQMTIHKSQIISFKQTDQEELFVLQKSVIERAVVGTLFFPFIGPIGAIAGGMSGLGSKEKIIKKDYLVINYWDTETRTPQTILISGEKDKIKTFIEKATKITDKSQPHAPKRSN